MNTTQDLKILAHIKQNKRGITSLEAFRLYGITRLSARIHTLRHKMGVKIDSVRCTGTTRDGNLCNFVRYVYEGEKGNE